MKSIHKNIIMILLLFLSVFPFFGSYHADNEISVPKIIVTGDVNENGKYTSKVVVTFEKVDGIDIYYDRFTNGNFTHGYVKFNNSINLTTNGRHLISYYGQDSLLNQSTKGSITIDIILISTEDNEYVERNGSYVNYYKTSTPVKLPTSYSEKSNELRAVWVSTVSNIDIVKHSSEEQYKGVINTILDNVKNNNLNAIFFQVRPMNDAFYESDYAPFSRYLTGAEGVSPGWDVLEYIIDEAHRRGIEFHAWLNPYRVSSTTGVPKETQLSSLANNNFARMNPSLVMEDNDGKLILNPGEPEVVEYISNVVDELITKYKVDGIHFDDYFYSYSGTPTQEDQSAFTNNNPSKLSRADWRRKNIDDLIKGLSELIDAHNQEKNVHIKFGISPFGVWSSKNSSSGMPDGANVGNTMQSYSAQYADSKKWVEEGWLDYICPQLYWGFSHSSAPFADLVKWWAELCERSNVDLIIGQGFYRSVETQSDWTNANELLEQIRYASTYESVKGFSLFSYKTIINQSQNVLQAVKRLNDYYWTEQPMFPWPSDISDLRYTVTGTSNIDQGMIGGLDKDAYLYGEEITIEAIPQTGYKFKNWVIEGSTVDNLKSRTITFKVTGNTTIEAIFEVDKPFDFTLVIIGSSIIGGAALAALFTFIVRKRKGERSDDPENPSNSG
ncbi:family 10 glycosylhydrolase [Acholeplasma sp. OttesenSCG-928-E16]|nr:family 10 glycosylhydrolase [Acholeplasma sp. OttesenSCG-928-E16]